MIRSAAISADGKYRYRLDRNWFNGDLLADGGAGGVDVSMSARACVFIMLNPSTADGDKDDPTIRRCVGFAKAWGYFALTVVNLYAYRATDPVALLQVGPSAIGPENDAYVLDAVNHAPLAVAAWGASTQPIPEQAERITDLCRKINPLAFSVLGLTRNGHPRHPLYVKGSTRPSVWTSENRPPRRLGYR
jgi:hypothetical protein